MVEELSSGASRAASTLIITNADLKWQGRQCAGAGRVGSVHVEQAATNVWACPGSQLTARLTVLAASGVCVPAKTYAKCLDDFFRVVEKGRCGGLPNPCGIAGDILATDTEPQRQFLMKADEYASYHAGVAVAAEARRDFDEANRRWCLVFNGEY